MEIECRFFANFRDAVGQKTLDWDTDDEATVGDVLASLEAEFDIQLIEDGEIRDGLSILKNGRGVVHMEGLETPLAADDELSVFPPVAGGTIDRPALESDRHPEPEPDQRT